MKTGTQIKKVDYQLLSGKRCKVCNKPLKQNSTQKEHTMCYVCFKLSIGKRYFNHHNINYDRLEMQKANIKKYKHEKG